MFFPKPLPPPPPFMCYGAERGVVKKGWVILDV